MFLKNLQKIILIGFTLIMFLSCSTEDEIFDQQSPQSEISSALMSKISQATSNSMAMTTFQSQINWYQNLDPANCDVVALSLIFELFDAQGNPLNYYDLLYWQSEFQTLESLVNEQLEYYNSQFQQEVTMVFGAGVIIKSIGNSDDYEYAFVNSFDIFLDYFEDCQSNSVVFQDYDGNIGWDLITPPDSEEEIVFPETPCLSFVFPLQILVTNNNPNDQPFAVTVDEDEFYEYISGQFPNVTVLDFVYPLTLISANGTQFTVNNITQLENLFEQQCN
jgi:hypothetical protein